MNLRSITVQQRGNFVCREVGPSLHSNDPGAPLATLLWIHGLGESGLCFERLLCAPELGSYQHVAPDLIGYGRSTWPQEGAVLSLADQAHGLKRLIETGLPGRVVVIGHSMGGVVGQLLCEAKPEAVVAFVNLEGNLSLGDCGYSSKASPQTLEEFTSVGFERLLGEIFAAGASDAAHRSYFASCSLSQPATFHRNACELVTLSKEEGLSQRFAALEINRAFVQGHPDGAPARSAELLRKNGVEPLVFEPAGHWPFIDQHQPFVEWLTGFLADL